ncbi:cysteine desulfurase NifS [Anaerosporomusa subterranea]|jgi:cysteine desulfurase|uniref:Cysteine desulfurase IscS n=1 Tax=Anaerosporomusa subterranea TaxID=1794912 RepID=A0A154BUE5_ANASB|nr:cysteine desulfurase NifS [Anaerosporomusa subterranea]KYZ77551.1 cysteine desulfurase NifS [Anaerosporomusa subterranea]MDF2501726.1 iscS 1 [Anaerosporomusa subterranea]
MKRIYFDHSATTPVHPEVVATMMEYLTDKFGNPSSVHSFGRETRKAVDEARAKVADLIGAEPNEIFFTSGGTESDNLALKGIAYANRKKGNHIITSAIEHHAILHTCEYLANQGFQITYLPVDQYGMVSVDDVRNAITDQTILISIMFANNEVGTIQPIREIGKLAREKKIFFHTDATQAVGHYPINVKEDNIDLLTMAGHKFNAPKGVGALYARRGVRLESLQQGGAHERNMRAGTENVPGIVAIGKAAEIAKRDMNEQIAHLQGLRDKLISQVLATIPHTQLNGHPTQRMPGSVNFSFHFIEGESLLLNLDLKGIAASSGSACTSGSLDPSHVLLAMGLTHEVAHGSLRITMGLGNTEEEVDYLLEVLPEIVARLRSMSPLYGAAASEQVSNPCSTCHRHE